MIPLDSFEALSITGKFVPIVPGGSHIRLTYANRKEYCEKALQFRLHELDVQVKQLININYDVASWHYSAGRKYDNKNRHFKNFTSMPVASTIYATAWLYSLFCTIMYSRNNATNLGMGDTYCNNNILVVSQ